jgi:hypothetical protein
MVEFLVTGGDGGVLPPVLLTNEPNDSLGKKKEKTEGARRKRGGKGGGKGEAEKQFM